MQSPLSSVGATGERRQHVIALRNRSRQHRFQGTWLLDLAGALDEGAAFSGKVVETERSGQTDELVRDTGDYFRRMLVAFKLVAPTDEVDFEPRYECCGFLCTEGLLQLLDFTGRCGHEQLSQDKIHRARLLARFEPCNN
ncbi:MAG: hypothetical protein NW205_05635 [Hyphomicrobiaceae bacterium]|nr:hypothetical protein [Hyphomicrobiaceae bacterium]